MSDVEQNPDEILIKIPTSIFEKQKEEKEALSASNKAEKLFRQFERTNIKLVRARQNSEHGLTQIQTLSFVEADQRQKVLLLLDNPALYGKFSTLLDYLFELGQDRDGEIRYYAAVAIGELAKQQPFLDLKERAILPWAKNEYLYCRVSAARALSFIIEYEHCETDTLYLLKHWTNSSNIGLIDTALMAYYRIAGSYPQETLEAIETVLYDENPLSYFQIFDTGEIIETVAKTYEFYPEQVMEYLQKWIKQTEKPQPRWVAGLWFLLIVRLEDMAKDGDSRQKAVEIIFDLWDNPKMPLHLEIQELTTAQVKNWADKALKVWEDDEVFEACQLLFSDLYRKYEKEGKRRNRLDFFLQRWQKQREREQARAARRGKIDTENQQQLDYTNLIPSTNS